MVGTAVFPVTYNSNTVASGRDDDVRSTVGSEISTPKFVDNTIHHAVYSRGTDATTGRYMQLSRPKTTDFQVTHERTYDIIEEESSVILKHSAIAGVDEGITPFFSETSLTTGTTPPLFLFTKGGRMIPDTVTTVAKGSRLDFRNLKGLPPSGVSSSFITGAKVHAGQIVDVGLRTSDLVMSLFKEKTHSLNSVGVGRPFAGPRTEEISTYKGANLAHHSTKFLSKNFISTTVPDAVRFLGRHDNYFLYYDRFGNFIYIPDGFSNVDKKIDPLISSNVETDTVLDSANRVTVRGKIVSANNNNKATVDDVELQKRDGMVKHTSIFDPIANTLMAARRSANQYLRLNRKAQGVVKSKNHQMAWELYPGDIINYKSPIDGGLSRKAVLEVEHSLHDMSSDFQLISYETGIERVMQDHSSQINDEEESVSSDKVKRLDMGGGDRALLKIRGGFYTRGVSSLLSRLNSDPSDYNLNDIGNDIHSGFLIGHRNYDLGNASGRSAIGVGLTPRLTGGTYSNGTITVSSTTGFPDTGYLIIVDSTPQPFRNQRMAQYTGKTGTTFTGVTVQAPNGAIIPASGLSIRLFRSRGHEMRTVKGLTLGRPL